MSYPSSAEHKAAWLAELCWCSWHHGWVPFAEAHRQVGSPNTVWCCRECVMALDAKEKRAVPDAVIELKHTPLPPRLGALFSMMEEDDE